ncbi:MAG: ATP-binding cassette domain-containing protein [Gemmatimonadaceae bacterium]
MIALDGLIARAGTFELRDVSFTVPSGGYGVVIGAAGSGKTTLLETIAGVRPRRGGRISLRAGSSGEVRNVDGIPPEDRGIGFVYQHGYLFPHLSVEENVAYGARDTESAMEAASRIGADELFKRDIRGLSGGEQQLVAIARALAKRPGILLLDEPYSALDPRRRALVRREVRAIHREWGMTTLQVTHDFTEAGLLGDVAVLLDKGQVLQAGPPEQIFRRPSSPYIAELLGAENVFAGVVRMVSEPQPSMGEAQEDSGSPHRAIEFRTGPLTIFAIGDNPDGAGYAVIRAEEVLVSLEAHQSSARNRFRGEITEVAQLGALTRVTIDIDGVPLVAALTTRSAHELGLGRGVEVYASFKAMAVHLC